jgi:hypothetical protein
LSTRVLTEAERQLRIEQQLRECRATLENCQRDFVGAEQEQAKAQAEYRSAEEALTIQQRRHEAAWALLNDANKKHVRLKDAIFQTGEQIKKLEAELNQ